MNNDNLHNLLGAADEAETTNTEEPNAPLGTSVKDGYSPAGLGSTNLQPVLEALQQLKSSNGNLTSQSSIPPLLYQFFQWLEKTAVLQNSNNANLQNAVIEPKLNTQSVDNSTKETSTKQNSTSPGAKSADNRLTDQYSMLLKQLNTLRSLAPTSVNEQENRNGKQKEQAEEKNNELSVLSSAIEKLTEIVSNQSKQSAPRDQEEQKCGDQNQKSSVQTHSISQLMESLEENDTSHGEDPPGKTSVPPEEFQFKMKEEKAVSFYANNTGKNQKYEAWTTKVYRKRGLWIWLYHKGEQTMFEALHYWAPLKPDKVLFVP